MDPVNTRDFPSDYLIDEISVVLFCHQIFVYQVSIKLLMTNLSWCEKALAHEDLFCIWATLCRVQDHPFEEQEPWLLIFLLTKDPTCEKNWYELNYEGYNKEMNLMKAMGNQWFSIKSHRLFNSVLYIEALIDGYIDWVENVLVWMSCKSR